VAKCTALTMLVDTMCTEDSFTKLPRLDKLFYCHSLAEPIDCDYVVGC